MNLTVHHINEVCENDLLQFVKSELEKMNIYYTGLSLIRNKDGVSVWRVTTDRGSIVLKSFEKVEYRREISNYQLLISLNVPTLRVIAYTDCSIVLEDIERSMYRLGTMEDINHPQIAEKIAIWYKTLHQNGKDYANTHDFIDEYDNLTLDNIKLIQERTGTSELVVWRVIEEQFETIRAAAMSLSRSLVYTDFYYTNLAVARDNTSALIFDYNFLFKSYVYSDIRNVCGNFYNEEAKRSFLSTYGAFDEYEVVVDNVVSVLSALLIASERKIFPNWAKSLLEKVKDGSLLKAVEELLDTFKRTSGKEQSMC